jgi:hypothetical protein
MGMTQVVEETVTHARRAYLGDQQSSSLHHLSADLETLWPQIDHLIYLPVLGLSRPRDLYYYQGDGLRSLYGFTYKYLTVEHFVGQLTRVQVGAALAERLAYRYARAWYPGSDPLTLFVDWHIKPHWTKTYSHTGHVTMWGRSMPGTKQLILTGPAGRLLGGWNYPIDAHLTHVLVDLEVALEGTLQRPIVCTVVDGEGGGLPLAERYAAAKRMYISILPRHHEHHLAEFDLIGTWQPVKDDPEREAILARWTDAQKAATDPRHMVLMRPLGETKPTRIYIGQFSAQFPAALVPWMHRRRWSCNELRIRDLIQGANLNCNYGYTSTEVPNRTRQRQWDAAQDKVTRTEQQLAEQQTAVHNLRQRWTELQDTYAQQQRSLEQQRIQQRQQLRQCQRLGQATARCQQRLCLPRHKQTDPDQRFQKQQRALFRQLQHHRQQSQVLRARLRSRIAVREAIDTPPMCRERDLEKDQIMLNLQIVLANLHDWATAHYFAPEWQSLTLEKATQMIYRKAGRVTWFPDRIEVTLEPYRYRDQQRAMETTCARFNAAHLRWRDGRLLRLSVQRPD